MLHTKRWVLTGHQLQVKAKTQYKPLAHQCILDWLTLNIEGIVYQTLIALPKLPWLGNYFMKQVTSATT